MMYDDNAFDLNSDQFFPEGDEPSNQEEAAEEAPAAEAVSNTHLTLPTISSV